MDKRSKQLFNDEILAESAKRFDTTFDQVNKVGGFENIIYEFNRDGQEYILRIGHSFHRSKEDMHGELDWIHYLAENDVSVSRPILSANQQLLEIVETGHSYFLVSAFEKASGSRVTKETWNEQLFEEWGRITGQMHRLTKDYVPRTGSKRYAWYEEGFITEAPSYLPADHQIVIQKYEEIVNHIKQLPQNRDSYGLIHTDLHGGNFFVDNGKITAFDFDDCAYHYFINDIAIPLFYALLGTLSGPDKKSFSNIFMKHFMRGYRSENDLDSNWLEIIPDFLKLREIELYTVLHRSVDMNNMDEFTKRYLENRKEWIEQDVPYLNLTAADFKHI